ncbi:uncharacterized protein LOC102809083, partial [Saccoglossus kowalevskii]
MTFFVPVILTIVSCLAATIQGQGRCVPCRLRSPDYSSCTCLPNVHGCEIELNSGNQIATPKFSGQEQGSVYSCVPKVENPNYEVHVIANYEGDGHTGFRQHNTGYTTLNIHGRGSSKPLILVLSTYEPVHWTLNFSNPDTVIDTVVLFAYHLTRSGITHQDGRVGSIEKSNDIACAYGSDTGGCYTVDLLKFIENNYGSVTSFSGTYKANEWNLVLQEDSPTHSVSCGFEDDGICGYTQAVDDDFDWERRTGYSGLFGPSSSNMYRHGFYMRASAGAGSIPGRPYSPAEGESDKARLISPSYQTTSANQCLKFHYYCATNGRGQHRSRLNVYTMTDSGLGYPIWARPRCNEQAWHTKEITINGVDSSSYRVVFETVHSGWPYTNMAIDDVTLVEGRCGDTSPGNQNQLRCYCDECNSRNNTCVTDGSCYGEKVVIGRREQYSFRCLDKVVLEAAPYLCMPSAGRALLQTVTVCCHDADMCNLRIIEGIPQRTPAPPSTTITTTTESPFADKPGQCPDLSQEYDSFCEWQCNHDPECAGDEKCCFTGCGTTCTMPANTVHAGSCPVITLGIFRSCTGRPDSCNSDDDCRLNEKCCSTGSRCGRACVPSIIHDVQKPGTCPFFPYGLRGAHCGDQCITDSDCPSNEKCCSTHCGHICSTPIEAFKPGTCPAITGIGTCQEECSGDADCNGDNKCCSNGCGHVCAQPVPKVPSEPEYEMCWTGSVCGGCNPDYVGSVNGLQVCCPHCREQGLRIIGRNCTCVKEIAGNNNNDDEKEEGNDDDEAVSEEQWTRRNFMYDDSYTTCTGD